MTDDYSHLPPVMARVCRALERLAKNAKHGELVSLTRIDEARAALAAARQYRGEGVREAAQRLVNNALVDDYGSIIPDEDDWVALENALTYTPKEPSHD